MPIRVENINFLIKKKHILKDVSFTVNSGEVTTILGANGAGKSSILKIMASEFNSSTGNIYFNDKNSKNISIKEIAKIRAVLPQDYVLTFPFSVADVVMLGRSPYIRGIETEQDYLLVDKAMKMTDVFDFREKFYTELSGGEQQRVQIARVLAQTWSDDNISEKFVMLDEPTSNLDPKHQHLILKTFRDLSRESNIGIFTVLHDLNLAAQYSDNIILLKDGYLKYYGKPDDVLTESNIKDIFDINMKVINDSDKKYYMFSI